jgi:hypothetical protein
METETKGCVLDIHFGGDTHFDLRCVTVAHLQRLACISITRSMHSTLTAAHADVATSWFLLLRERQDMQLTD